MPRGCYEPWGILRKPLLRGMKVSGTLGTILTVMLVASAAGMAIARYLT